MINTTLFISVPAVAAAVSAAVAAIALLFNAYALMEARRTRQLQIFDRVFGSILELDAKLQELALAGKGQDAARAWRSQFLNTLEYLAFLVNRRFLNDSRLWGFFSQAVIRWYEDIFRAVAQHRELSDPEIYPELKALYSQLSKNKQSN